ncbi:eae-like domain protein [Citrobacter freundii]|uniref:eae-like domain protein n=1 Tax=Citrobacter freundii TaxID=546 RepID=UPI00388ED766
MTSREKFEAWYLENLGHTEDDHETLFERDPDSDEEYYRLGVRLAHEAWQAAELASEQKLTDMAVQLANAESKCRELAAENSALKATCDDRRTFIMNGVQLGYIKVPTVDTDPALETIRIAVSPQEPTPVTDTFLAEVRAQGVDYAIGVIEDCANNLSPGGTGEAVQYAQEMVNPYLDSIHDKLADKSAQLRKGGAA